MGEVERLQAEYEGALRRAHDWIDKLDANLKREEPIPYLYTYFIDNAYDEIRGMVNVNIALRDAIRREDER